MALTEVAADRRFPPAIKRRSLHRAGGLFRPFPGDTACRTRTASGEAGLVDKSSRPDLMPTMIPEKIAAKIEALRRRGLTYAQISAMLDVPHSTVGIVAKRRGVADLKSLDPHEPARRYERKAPGELVHFDTKKLGRIGYLGHRITGRRRGQRHGLGWEVVHLCIDDHSRVSYVEVLPDETRETTASFAERAIAWFASHGVRIARAMSDNGSAYRSMDELKGLVQRPQEIGGAHGKPDRSESRVADANLLVDGA